MNLNIRSIIQEEIGKMVEMDRIFDKFPDLKSKVLSFNDLVDEHHSDVQKIKNDLMKIGLEGDISKIKQLDDKIVKIISEFKEVQSYVDNFLKRAEITDDESFVIESISDKIDRYVFIVETIQDMIYNYKSYIEKFKEEIGKKMMNTINSLDNIDQGKYKIFLN